MATMNTKKALSEKTRGSLRGLLRNPTRTNAPMQRPMPYRSGTVPVAPVPPQSVPPNAIRTLPSRLGSGARPSAPVSPALQRGRSSTQSQWNQMHPGETAAQNRASYLREVLRPRQAVSRRRSRGQLKAGRPGPPGSGIELY